MVGFFGFGALGVLWLWTGWRGYRAIRAGDVPQPPGVDDPQRRPDLRGGDAAALVGVLMGVQPPFPDRGVQVKVALTNAYAAVPFLCWLTNLVVAEWLIRRRDLPPCAWWPPARALPVAERSDRPVHV